MLKSIKMVQCVNKRQESNHIFMWWICQCINKYPCGVYILLVSSNFNTRRRRLWRLVVVVVIVIIHLSHVWILQNEDKKIKAATVAAARLQIWQKKKKKRTPNRTQILWCILLYFIYAISEWEVKQTIYFIINVHESRECMYTVNATWLYYISLKLTQFYWSCNNKCILIMNK